MKLCKYLRVQWRRLYFKIVREKATPEYIAKGWTVGIFYGCILPFGAQLIFSIPTAFLIKGSKIGAIAGTFITNHLTIFIIYPVQCYIGNLLIGGDLEYCKINAAMSGVIKEQNLEALGKLGMDLTISFFIGGALFAAILTPLTYFSVKKSVGKYQSRRMKKTKFDHESQKNHPDKIKEQ